MKTRVFIASVVVFSVAFISCGEFVLPEWGEPSQAETEPTALSVDPSTEGLSFGVAAGQTWVMSQMYTLRATTLPTDIVPSALAVYATNPLADSTAVLLAETDNPYSQLKYELPTYVSGPLYAACIAPDGQMRVREFDIAGGTVDFSTELFTTVSGGSEIAPTRAIAQSAATALSWTPTLNAELFASDGWADEFALVDRDKTYTQFVNMSDVVATFKGFLNSNTNHRILNAYPEIRNAQYITVGATGGEVAVTPVFQETSASWMFGYYYFLPGEVQNVKTVRKYIFSDAVAKINSNVTAADMPTYRLVYYDKDGNASYNFPAGTRIGFVCHVRQNSVSRLGVTNTYVNWYGGSGALNVDLSNALYANGIANGNVYGGRDGWQEYSHIAIFERNGTKYVGFEDWTDFDYNDLVLVMQGSGIDALPQAYEPRSQLSQVYTFAFEDTPGGDYDLNDVVLRVTRESTYVWGQGNRPCLKVRLAAVGAYDKLKVCFADPVTGEVRELFGGREVHEVLSLPADEFANTQQINVTTKVEEIITTPEDYNRMSSILISKADLFIVNMTRGYEVHTPASKGLKGVAPCGICVPFEWQWPTEGESIQSAYEDFATYAADYSSNLDWYTSPSGQTIKYNVQ